MALATLLHYHTVAGMLLPVNNSVVDAALARAQAKVGEAAWKAGFTGQTKGGATEIARAELELIGIKAKPAVGALSSVRLAETTDGAGNVYPKVRIKLDAPEGDTMISLDTDSEVAQRLAQKLLNTVPGEILIIEPFSVVVGKGGRTFVNHAVSVKRGDGTEVKAPPNLWTQAQNMADDAETALKLAGITDKAVINKAKASKKVEFHVALYRGKICPQFVDPSPPA